MTSEISPLLAIKARRQFGADRMSADPLVITPHLRRLGTMPRRSMWSGTIEFGMTSIPIKVYAALDSDRGEMHTYHTTCGRRVTMPKVCTECETEVSSDELSSGVDYTQGRNILFSKRELAALTPLPTRTLIVTQFCPESDVDPVLFDTVHHVMAAGDGTAFSSLQAAMLRRNVLAIGRVTFRSKDSLVALRAVEGGIICHSLHWPEMVREAEWKDLVPPLSLDQACDVIDELTTTFVPSEHKDEQRAAIDAFIDRKKNALDCG